MFMSSFVFAKALPEEGWKVRADAIEASGKLRDLIRKRLEEMSAKEVYVRISLVFHDTLILRISQIPLSWVPRIFNELWGGQQVKPPSVVSFLDRLSKASRSSVGRFSFISSLPEVDPLLKRLSRLVDESGKPLKETVKPEGPPKEDTSKAEDPSVEETHLTPKQLAEGKKMLEQLRLVSTTLGLSVVSSVNFAQGRLSPFTKERQPDYRYSLHTSGRLLPQ